MLAPPLKLLGGGGLPPPPAPPLPTPMMVLILEREATKSPKLFCGLTNSMSDSKYRGNMRKLFIAENF